MQTATHFRPTIPNPPLPARVRLLATDRRGATYHETEDGAIERDNGQFSELLHLPEHWRVFARRVQNYPVHFTPTVDFYLWANERQTKELFR